MGMRPSGEVNDGEGNGLAVDQIGHVYANVKIVAENIDAIDAVADGLENLGDLQAAIEGIDADRVAAEAAAATATTQAGLALTRANEALGSKNSAKTSQLAAAASEDAAEADAAAAHADMLAADADRIAAETAAANANIAEANAEAHAAAALASRNQAATSETNAAASAASADISEANAATSAAGALASASTATSESTEAQTAATNAVNAANAADADRILAEAARIAAEQARDEAEAIVGGDYVTQAEVGVANGVVPTDGTNKIPVAFMPDAVLGSMRFQSTWNAATNTPAIPAAAEANRGYYYIVGTAGTTSIDGVADWEVGDWVVSNGTTWAKIDNSDKVSSVAGKTGAVTLVKGDVGLGNVDNTADANKPVSGPQLTALNLKANLSGGNSFVGAQSIDQGNQVHVPAIDITNIGAGMSGIRFTRAGAAGLMVLGTTGIGGGAPWTFDSTHRTFAFRTNNNADDTATQIMYIGNQGTLTRGLLRLKQETAGATGDYLICVDAGDVSKFRVTSAGNIYCGTIDAGGIITTTAELWINGAAGTTRYLAFRTAGAYAADINLSTDNTTLRHNSASAHEFYIAGTKRFEIGGGGVGVAGDITSTTGNIVSQAPAGQNAAYWMRNESGTNQGLIYWNRAADNLRLVRYNAAGNAAEGELIIGAADVSFNGNTLWHSGTLPSPLDKTVGGTITATTNYISTGNLAAAVTNLHCLGDADDGAWMAFHRFGTYAVFMGLDTDNVFRLGGWSAGNAKLSVNMVDGTVQTGGETLWVNTDKLLLQYTGGHSYIRSQVGNLSLGAGGVSTLVLTAAGAVAATGDVSAPTFSVLRAGTNPIITLRKGAANTFTIQCDENSIYEIGPSIYKRAAGHFWQSENGATAYMNIGLDSGTPRLTVNGNATMKDLIVTRGDGTGALFFGGGAEYLYWDTANFTLTDDLIVQGNITSPSDRRLKKHISYQFHYGLSQVMQLKPVSYRWKKGKGKERAHKEIGLIAQDVQSIAPELVQEAKDGTLTVDYQRLSILLLAAVKELTARVEKLEA